MKLKDLVQLQEHIYFLSYSFNSPGNNRDDFCADFEKKYIKLINKFHSAYLFKTADDIDKIRHDLLNYFNDSDVMFIIEITDLDSIHHIGLDSQECRFIGYNV